MLRRARQQRSAGDLPGADATMTSYLAIHPDALDATLMLAHLKVAEHDPAAALTLLRHALDLSPNSPDANNTLGTLLLEDRHYPEAMDRFETVLAIASTDSNARAGEQAAADALALQAKSAGHPEAALLCLEHALERLPGNVDLLTNAGIVAGELHLNARAEHFFTAALAADSHSARTLYAAGRAATDAGHLVEAERYLRAYLALRPQDATAYFGLGRVLLMQLKTADAQAAFERSIALKPVQSESYYQLGVLAAEAGRDAEASELFTKTLARAPAHAGALTGLGQIADRARDFALARRHLEAATQSDPEYQPAHYYLGLTLARLGEQARSSDELARATQLATLQQSKAAPVRSEASIP